VAASVSPAEAGLFTAAVGGTETAKIDGGQTVETGDAFAVNSILMKCMTATSTGSALAAGTQSEELEVTPTYSGCTAKVAGQTRTLTVTLNGCKYRMKLTRNPLEMHLTICSSGGPIEIHLYTTSNTETAVECTYDVPQQTVTIPLENKTGSPNDIVAKPNVTLSATNTITNALCGPNSTETFTYKGEDTFQATTEAGPLVNSSVS
jgi:hypothetical protein